METRDRGNCDPKTGCLQAHHVIMLIHKLPTIPGVYPDRNNFRQPWPFSTNSQFLAHCAWACCVRLEYQILL